MEQIRHLEAIIRLVKYQLTEVLPLRLEAAGPPQSDDTTNLYLEPLRQVRTAYRAAEQDRWPAAVISPISSGPVSDADLLDQNARDCAAFQHEFAVHLVLAAADSQAEDLGYVLVRYVKELIDAVCGFEMQALVDACTASQLTPFLCEIVPGDAAYSEPGNKSTMLREAIIGFTAYS